MTGSPQDAVDYWHDDAHMMHRHSVRMAWPELDSRLDSYQPSELIPNTGPKHAKKGSAKTSRVVEAILFGATLLLLGAAIGIAIQFAILSPYLSR